MYEVIKMKKYLSIILALLMLVMEALPHIPGLTWLDDMDAATQLRLLPVLIGGILIYTGCTLLTFRAAAGAAGRHPGHHDHGGHIGG